jgi:GH25 family lysozyme M1 (1,4-beta-N-acetylmuramidase)
MVKAAGFEGMMHRATLGLNQTDPMFVTRMLSAHAAGLVVGATHLFFPSDDPKLQAQQFAAKVNRFSPLLLAVDLEWVTKNGKEDWDTVEDPEGLIEAFFAELATFFTGTFLEYRGLPFSQQYLPTYVSKNKLWVPDYSNNPPRLPADFVTYEIWQTGQGTVAGVQGPVDMDQTAEGVNLQDLFCTAI